jgi:hypothetical protein
MEARRLIDGAPFNPELAKACGEAFDQAWVVVALRVLGAPEARVASLRMNLARAVLANAERCGTVDALIQAALSEVLPKAKAEP